jgi:hypothetical protein
MILRDHENSKNSLKIKSPNALSTAQRRGGGEPEQYAPDATRECMENAFLNTGANCERYVSTVLQVHNVLWFRTRELFIHKSYIKIYRKIFSSVQSW